MNLTKMLLTAVAVFGVIGSAKADYVQTFDSGSAVFTVNDPYWLDNGLANGFITKTTNSAAVYGNEFGAEIPHDVSGTGYFLFEGTYLYQDVSGTIPAGQNEFFISPTFAVAPNTVYNVSFYATSSNGVANPAVQPEIGGSLLGSPSTPVGDFASNGWQQFTYSWNSGANTTASLILHDFTATNGGNDFGVDDIAVTSTAAPEPAMLGLLCFGFAALVAWKRKIILP